MMYGGVIGDTWRSSARGLVFGGMLGFIAKQSVAMFEDWRLEKAWARKYADASHVRW